MKHTPAPWSVQGRSEIWGNPTKDSDSSTSWTGVTGFTPNPADAALIAAAPEMIYALVEAETYLHSVLGLAHDDVTENVLNTVRAAIAKATGGAA